MKNKNKYYVIEFNYSNTRFSDYYNHHSLFNVCLSSLDKAYIFGCYQCAKGCLLSIYEQDLLPDGCYSACIKSLILGDINE